MNMMWREERNRASLAFIKNVNLYVQCDQTFNIFVKDNQLINNAKCTKNITFILMLFYFVPLSSEKYYIFHDVLFFLSNLAVKYNIFLKKCWQP